MLRKIPLVPWWRTRFQEETQFEFDGQRYRYLYHRYGRTWMTERTVEVPIAWKALQKFAGKRVLEVGNVLSNYFATDHTIVDKYERAPRVINEDVVAFQDQQGFDFILSVSTLEHVGWDEPQEEPDKIPRAVQRLKELLQPGGELLLTLPLGYNPHLDRLLADGALGTTQNRYLRRVSGNNRWVQASWSEVRSARYDDPFDWANALAICQFRKAA
jgi:SAM-dependent methyltransferase